MTFLRDEIKAKLQATLDEFFAKHNRGGGYEIERLRAALDVLEDLSEEIAFRLNK